MLFFNFPFFLSGKKKGAEQYILSSATMGWSEAQNYCRTNHTDLTSVRNDAEHQIIQSLANGMDVWIGLFKDPWEWSDQSNSSLRYWPVEQKIWTEETEHCGALMKNESGKWGQLPCSNKYPFLCVCKVKGRYLIYSISCCFYCVNIWTKHTEMMNEQFSAYMFLSTYNRNHSQSD